MREQTFAFVSLLVLGIGTAITGFFPTVVGLYATTVLMSIGFHYFESLRQSLALQWTEKEHAPYVPGPDDRRHLARLAGGVRADLSGARYFRPRHALGLSARRRDHGDRVVAAWIAFPRFEAKVEQHKQIVLRGRYWLYYALVFMSGARRQIFVVFAGFLMVEKFGFDAAAIALMFLVNGAINVFAAPRIGKLIGRWGERRALTFEYVGLIGVFTAYAFVETAWIAVGLYIVDHLFFSLAIAVKTYFQKIADPADMASSAGVSFTISHIAAVVIPAAFGFLWLVSPSIVFLAGAAMAAVSLALSRMVPPAPSPEVVAVVGRAPAYPRAAAAG